MNNITIFTTQDAAQDAAAAFIPATHRAMGVTTWADYCALNDQEAVAHLDPGTAAQMLRKRPGRHPVPILEDDGTVTLLVPAFFKGQTLTVQVGLTDWVMLQEGGWRGLWCVNAGAAGSLTTKAQRPMARGGKANEQPVARVILKGDERSRVKFINGNSLDLRRPNLRLVKCAGGRLTNARGLAREGIASRKLD